MQSFTGIFFGDLCTFPTTFLVLLIPAITLKKSAVNWFYSFISGLHPTIISVWGWFAQQSTTFFYSLAASSFLPFFIGSWSIAVQAVAVLAFMTPWANLTSSAAFVETCVAEEEDGSSSWLVAEGALKYNINDECINSTIKWICY